MSDSKRVIIGSEQNDDRKVELQVLGTTVVIPVAEIDSTGTIATPDVLRGYKINDLEEGSTNYYGFERADGAWYILRSTTSATVFRYAKGSSNYSTAWTNRASQSYSTFGATF